MIDIYIYTIASVVAVSLISLIGIFTLALREDLIKKYTFLLVSLAIGALLGDAFIHLIPEAMAELGSTQAAIMVIAGILIFFVLEKVLHWHHHHGYEEEEYPVEPISSDQQRVHPIGYMVLVSDSVHNLLDGVIIGASFLVSIEVGIATTIAVILHEIPQEIGDFGVLLHSGFSKGRALLMNFLSALLAVLGAVVVLVLHSVAEPFAVLMVPIAAGAFIYIAASDLIPELHKTKHPGHSIVQFAVVVLGVATMIGLTYAEGEAGHSHGNSGHENEQVEMHNAERHEEEAHHEEEHGHEDEHME